MSAKIAGLILAAGQSRRMGEPKALLHLGGRPILDGLLEVYRASRLDPVIVVASGPVLVAAAERPGIVLVPGDPEAPMIDSVARGVAMIPARHSAVVVQPADAPFTVEEMIAALKMGDVSRSRALCHQGRPGHPVLVSRSAFPAIMERPAGGLRAILSQLEIELVEWPDPRILADLDTPDDVARWRGSDHLH